MVDIELDEVRRLTRAEYDEMCERGMFDDERVELLRGLLVKKMSEGFEHFDLCWRLQNFLVRKVPDNYAVSMNQPYCATDDSEPEPDVYIFDPSITPNKKPTEAKLVIEIAVSSLRRDRGIKQGIYAEARVPTYWIIDVMARKTEVYTQPSDDGYRVCTIVPFEEPLTLGFEPAVELTLTQFEPALVG
ncbi:MAG: Uma2 family endonuclease [Kofleriaceae bacterium]